jgi:class 3 adenylate cyclase/pimeloyl-ACP methyl ester carboxylesterase
MLCATDRGRRVLELGPTRYETTVDGLSIAYKRWGRGDRDLVLVPGTIWHSELIFECAPHRRLAERLGAIARVISFDKRGTGLSDRHLGTGSLDDRILDVTAVMDDAGVTQATVMGLSEGGAMGALVAASLPARVDSLVLCMGLIYGPFCSDHPRPAAGRAYGDKLLAHFRETWGTGEALPVWFDGPGTPPGRDSLQRLEQYMFTPRGVVEVMRRNMEIDVRPVLSLIAVPTLIVHAVGDRMIPISQARLAASAIPQATLVELSLTYHGAWTPEAFDDYVDVIEEWFTGRPPVAPVRTDRVLATVVFTDIVASSSMAVELGDAEWRARLDIHDVVVARSVARNGGRVVKTTGDGVLAIFDGPARALDCAVELRADLGRHGLHIRAGVHTGEIELRDRDVAGLGVHLAARVLAEAADDEIWVSPTVPGLVVGSGHRFEPRGTHALKGIPERWALAALITSGRPARTTARMQNGPPEARVG